MQILRDALMLGCSREHEARKTANMLQSTQACEAAEEACESVLEREQSGTLPSTGEAQSQMCYLVAKSIIKGKHAQRCSLSG